MVAVMSFVFHISYTWM